MEIKRINVVPFQLEHLEVIKLRAFELHRKEYIERFRKGYQEGPAYSALDVDDLIWCGGVVILWQGVGEAWILCSNCINHYIKELYHYTKAYLDVIIAEYNLHRVHASVLSEYRAGYRFLERMGFEREGLMHKYDWQGSDYYLYARIK